MPCRFYRDRKAPVLYLYWFEPFFPLLGPVGVFQKRGPKGPAYAAQDCLYCPKRGFVTGRQIGLQYPYRGGVLFLLGLFLPQTVGDELSGDAVDCLFLHARTAGGS